MRYLTFALGKGRLANKTLEMFEKIGITCEEMKDKDTRKLIFVNEDLKLRFFLAKGPDVPTYVEYGAADIGIVGRDTILQEARNIYEVLDLGFGKCRMCVCGPESARDLLQHHEQIRVATKYPKIAKDYFYNKKHQTVEIIKLNGSIELAPIVGLADVIVDIVETGSKRAGCVRRSVSVICTYGGKPGKYEDGAGTHQQADHRSAPGNERRRKVRYAYIKTDKGNHSEYTDRSVKEKS